jgi:hypothetical protein
MLWCWNAVWLRGGQRCRDLVRLAITAWFVTAGATIAIAGEWAGDAFYADWIGAQLRSLGEPILHQPVGGGDHEVYRMVVLPSFDHPVSIRVVASTSRAVVRMTDGWGGYGPGKLSFARVVPVVAADLKTLRTVLDDIGFWRMPTKAPLREVVEPDGTVSVIVCTDGTMIVLEAAVAGRYHMIHRSCTNKDDVAEVVKVFKRIAGRHLPDHLK